MALSATDARSSGEVLKAGSGRVEGGGGGGRGVSHDVFFTVGVPVWLRTGRRNGGKRPSLCVVQLYKLCCSYDNRYCVVMVCSAFLICSYALNDLQLFGKEREI
jgi:hypothetical protein